MTARQDGVDKGLEVFRQAIEKHPSEPMLLNNRGMFLQSRGRDSEAVADFTRAYEIDPKFTVASPTGVVAPQPVAVRGGGGGP